MACNTSVFPGHTAKRIKLDITQPEPIISNAPASGKEFSVDGGQSKLNCQLRAILSDKYFRPLETDGHLTVIIRVVQNDVTNNATTLSDLFKGTSVDTNGLCEPVITAVPSHPPLTRQQYEHWSKIWPMSFHEDKRFTKLINGEAFDAIELQEMESYMRQAIEVALIGREKGMLPIGGVIVDPKTKKILCKAYDLSTSHPLQHVTMVCIDLVGRLQGGGAWDIELDFRDDQCLVSGAHKQDDRSTSKKENQPCCLDKNINKDPVICEHNCCDDILKTGSCSSHSSLGDNDEDMPYLCTGYDLYITREPCVMCSMALLHSRIQRVFYAQPFPSFGGLGSGYKIHCLEETNHHFEVYAGLLEMECRRLLS